MQPPLRRREHLIGLLSPPSKGPLVNTALRDDDGGRRISMEDFVPTEQKVSTLNFLIHAQRRYKTFSLPKFTTIRNVLSILTSSSIFHSREFTVIDHRTLICSTTRDSHLLRSSLVPRLLKSSHVLVSHLLHLTCISYVPD